MPPKTAINGRLMIVLSLDYEKGELNPNLFWVGEKPIKKPKRLCQILRFWRLRNKNYYPKSRFKQILLWQVKAVQE